MSRPYLGILTPLLGVTLAASTAFAADYAAQPGRARYASPVLHIDRGPNPYCGPRNGCPEVVRVSHRTLEQTFGYHLDPRTRPDDPHYYYGRNRIYVRYANPRDPDFVLQY